MPQLLNPRHEAFAQHVAMGLPYTQAAKRAGYAQSVAHNSGSRVHKNPKVQARIEELKASKFAIVTGTGIRTNMARVIAIEDRWARMRMIIKERAEHPSMEDVPGGRSGLLCVDYKTVGSGDMAVIKTVYKLDAALLKALLEHEERAAIELGQQSIRHETFSSSVSLRANGKELHGTIASHLDQLTEEQRKLAAQLMPGLKVMLNGHGEPTDNSDVIEASVESKEDE